MKTNRYDVVVLGGGIGGYYCARSLAKGNKSVAIVENDLFGGTALRWGALPVKKVLDSFKGINKESKMVKETLINNWEDELNGLVKNIENSLLKDNIDIYYGNGEFLDSNRFRLDEVILEGDYFVIATGTEPSSIDGIHIDGKNIITHKEALNIKDLPDNIVILGGNVEGIEFAALYAELGVKVTLIEKEDCILPGNDYDLVEPIEKYLVEKGVKIIKGVGAKSAEVEGKGVNVLLDNGASIKGERCLVTLLRKPNFPRGIENTRIKTNKDKIITYENLLTDEKRIFAIGDINGILGMGHVAIQQGIQVANYILNNGPVKIFYDILPRAVFTLPEMAGVGKQEWELKRDNISYNVGISSFKDTWRGWAKGIQEGFVKVILNKDEVVLGVWMVGENVSEYVGLLKILIENKCTLGQILSSLVIHPSLNEAIVEALLQSRNKKVIK
ncbi:MAG: NAD(P)/FAD-dependent oxidoreductase [Tissierellia bacterium]|nr:NAD(P)/FAD-dependent oxidoreductase [Tissierellia bacterium]